jgi:hypothetical protein
MRAVTLAFVAVLAFAAFALAAQPADAVAVCTFDDHVNTGDAPCRGAACVGWDGYGWTRCYLDPGP